MCGVISVVGRNHEELCQRGLDRMSHRGIRSSIVHKEYWSIGHVRLPIVGTGLDHDQPVRRGDWHVGFVGEILDFRERNPEYECDAELVADLWNDHGAGGFHDRDGFWAVVAGNNRNGSVHALVDYLSQKPLYVRNHDDVIFSVASEPDAVACLAPVELDRTYMSAVAKWGYCPEPWRTPYAGIRRMLPGERMVCDRDLDVTMDVDNRLVPIPASIGSLREEVVAAVKRRVTSSDVPVGCLVSGGLDSSIVWTLASRYGNVLPFHVENGEKEDLMKVAPDAAVLDLPVVGSDRAVEVMQEPVDLGSLIPQIALSDAMRDKVTVCLTGDGADEFFGGYGRSQRYDSQASDVWHELVCWHLPRLDRVMMRNRIEVRSPFLARRVAGMALALPRNLRTDKRILRDLFRDDLPPGVADVPKRPLRMANVEADREGWSLELIRRFEERTERMNQESSCRR